MNHDMIYMGCFGSTGHFLWDTNLRQIPPSDFAALERELGIWPSLLDMRYAPGVSIDARRGVRCTEPQIEGRARVSRLNDWTILSFWDRSVDRRENSNSTFAMRGHFGFAQAVAKARSAFPRIWSRYEFGIVEAR